MLRHMKVHNFKKFRAAKFLEGFCWFNKKRNKFFSTTRQYYSGNNDVTENNKF